MQLQSLKIEKRATCGFVPKREYQGIIHSPELTPKKEQSYTNHAKNKTFTQVNKESCGATSNRTG